MSGRMKWINHPYWGWLPDDAPLMETATSVIDIPRQKPELRLLAGRKEDAPIIEGGLPVWAHDIEDEEYVWFDRAGESGCFYRPITTAARELLAALRAEVEK